MNMCRAKADGALERRLHPGLHLTGQQHLSESRTTKSVRGKILDWALAGSWHHNARLLR